MSAVHRHHNQQLTLSRVFNKMMKIKYAAISSKKEALTSKTENENVHIYI